MKDVKTIYAVYSKDLKVVSSSDGRVYAFDNYREAYRAWMQLNDVNKMYTVGTVRLVRPLP